MRKRIPNLLSATRIATVPLLVGLAVAGRRTLFFPGLVLTQATDFLDGYLARRLNAQSRLGAKLDVVGDAANYAAGFSGIGAFYPELFRGMGLLGSVIFGAVFVARFIVARAVTGEWVHPVPLVSARINFYVQCVFIVALVADATAILRPLFFVALTTATFESVHYLAAVVRRSSRPREPR